MKRQASRCMRVPRFPEKEKTMSILFPRIIAGVGLMLFRTSRNMAGLLIVMSLLSVNFLRADELSSLPQLKTYTLERATSSDPTGGNDDGNWKQPIKPGEQRTIASLMGPGIITHIWITIATPEDYHLKKIVLRAYWDGDTLPAIETPIGDFFGLGLG